MLTLQMVKVFDFEDYRHYLKYLLAKRIEDNCSYSLRAMSRDLDISPSTFSQILSKQRHPSLQKANSIAKKLNLPLQEKDFFVLLVQLQKAKNAADADKLKAQMTEIRPTGESIELKEGQFQIVANWYYSVILQLLSLDSFKATVPSISKALNLNKFIVIEAMDNLVQTQLAEVENGLYKRTSNRVFVEVEGVHHAVKNFYLQMMEKAKSHLENRPSNERAFGTETISINKNKKTDLEKLVNQFLDKVAKLADEDEKADSIYQVNVQTFPLASIKLEE